MALTSNVVIRGYLGTNPKRFEANGSTGCSFRLATTRGYFDRRTQQWKESPTTWVSVRAFRVLAENILTSLYKGDPVIVAGELVTDEWTQDGARRTSLSLQANCAGPDLNQGIFARFTRNRPRVEQDTASRGMSQEQQWQSSDSRTGAAEQMPAGETEDFRTITAGLENSSGEVRGNDAAANDENPEFSGFADGGDAAPETSSEASAAEPLHTKEAAMAA